MRVAVLGGGLQGACVAMELASAGISVDLYDKNDRCMSQASAQNEGKIHLGYVYANDRSLRTARTMVKGAIAFAPLMRRWLGDLVDSLPVSTPFHYVVHSDSLLGIDDVEQHFRSAHAVALEESQDIALDYFGADYRVPPVRMSGSECADLFDSRRVAAAYRTAEMSIDPEALAAAVRGRLAADPRINCVLRARVRGVTPDGNRIAIDFETSNGRARQSYDHAVNALWDGRLAVDQTLGLQPEGLVHGEPAVHGTRSCLRGGVCRARPLEVSKSMAIRLPVGVTPRTRARRTRLMRRSRRPNGRGRQRPAPRDRCSISAGGLGGRDRLDGRGRRTRCGASESGRHAVVPRAPK